VAPKVVGHFVRGGEMEAIIVVPYFPTWTNQDWGFSNFFELNQCLAEKV